MLSDSRNNITFRTSGSLHSSRASIRKRRGLDWHIFISKSKNLVSSPFCQSHVSCFFRLSRNKGMKRLHRTESCSSSWYSRERNIPRGVFSSVLPRALKKYAAIMWSLKISRQWSKVCFINVDFPAPGLPLIQSTPLWLGSSLRSRHCWNCVVWNNQLHVSRWAEAMSWWRASMLGKLRERKQAIPSQSLNGTV